MKKFALMAALIAAALSIQSGSAQSPSVSVPPGGASPRPSASGSPDGGGTNCRRNSWNPELYCFYGKKQNVIEKLDRIPTNLSEHRLIVQITQGNPNGNIRLFEQQKDGSFTVTQWSARETSNLLAKIDKAIMDNKGYDCVGKQVKGVLANLGKGKISENVATNATPKEAFTESVDEVSGDFVKSAVIILC